VSFFATSPHVNNSFLCDKQLTAITAEVKDKRTKILQEIINICKTTIDYTLQEEDSDCGFNLCPVVKAGIISKEFYRAGFHPVPENACAVKGSICGYWKTLRVIDFPYRIHSLHSLYDDSCEGTLGRFRCGSFGITTALRAILKQHTHKDLWKQYESYV
jgi:hypothetical protein